jgi:2-oxoglutarate ferredoxin oxidoreductase subunit delta
MVHSPVKMREINAIRKMAGKIIIDIERCKGCGLCVTVCPKNGIIISNRLNKAGYFPAEPVNKSDCTGCAMCAIVCPEAIIEVYSGDDSGDESKKNKPSLIKEKV